MTTMAKAGEGTTVRPQARGKAAGSIRFDWAVVAAGAWFLGGLFLDGWAHNHGKVDQSFFTPWHGVFYSGYMVVAAVILSEILRNRRHGYQGWNAIPAGYELSLLGIVVFGLGGLGDLIWHTLFGIEANLAALLSPTHLLLAVGLGLIMTGPLRAAWQRPDEALGRERTLFPAVLSLTCLLSLLSFMTQFAHPFVDAAIAGREFPGVVSILLQTGVLMGVVLFAMRRWSLPPGSLTILLTLNAILMSFMADRYFLIPAALLAGIAGDILLVALRPSPARPGSWHLFAFALPAIYYALYFLDYALRGAQLWVIHLWAGSIVIAGIIGWLLSYLVVPPSEPLALPGQAHRLED